MRRERANLQRGNRKIEVIDRTRRRREVKDEVDLARQINEIADIVLDEMKVLVAGEMLDVGDVSGEQVVHPDHLMSLAQQPVGEVRPEEAGAPGDE